MARPRKQKEITDEMVGNNKFVNDLLIPVRKKRKKDAELMDDKYEVFEATRYVKLYELAGMKKKLEELSVRGKEMYLHILYYLPYGKDWMTIDRKAYMEKYKIKSNHTFIDAIKELHEEIINIHPFLKDTFHINPAVFFNGSRTNKYPDKLTVKPWKKNEE